MFKIVLILNDGNKLVLTADINETTVDELIKKLSEPRKSDFTLLALPTRARDRLLIRNSSISAIHVYKEDKEESQ